MDEERKEGIVAIVIIAAVIIVIVGFINGWFQHETTTPEETFPVFVNDDPVKGSPDAPVTIIEFSDFSCPYCASFLNMTGPLLNEYIENGTVRFVFKDFPLTQIHPKAAQVAKAAGCADEQGLFWEYHDVVYANIQNQEIAHLHGYAQQVGLDMQAYGECFASDRRFAEIEDDLQTGRGLGVTGTPTFFVNGKRYGGVLTPEALKAAIADALQ